MDKDRLVAWIAEGLSLEAIGRLVDRSPSTVAYWIQKHDLAPAGRTRHAARGPLGRAELEALVARDLTMREIAEAVDRSPGTVRHWLRQYGLQTTATARRSAPRSDDGTRLVAVCRTHGPTTFAVRPDGASRCLRCRTDAVVRRRRRIKAVLVAEAGGRCTRCGYDRCVAALHFHHLDPATKSFQLGRHGVVRSLERARAEASKCVLLCSNCHAEVETGFAAPSS